MRGTNKARYLARRKPKRPSSGGIRQGPEVEIRGSENDLADTNLAPDFLEQLSDHGNTLFEIEANADTQARKNRTKILALQAISDFQRGDFQAAKARIKNAAGNGARKKAIGRVLATSSHLSLSRAWGLIGNSRRQHQQKQQAIKSSSPLFGAWLNLIEGSQQIAKGEQTEFQQLYATKEGKVSDKWESYLPNYEKWCTPYKNFRVRLLEIGVQNGGSLEIWAKYFPRAEIILGSDINADCGRLQFQDHRIKIVLGDINAADVRSQIMAHSDRFDIIIDDGAHTSTSILEAFSGYFSKLSYGGLYIIEDLHCSYWPKFGGGLRGERTSIEFFKRLIDFMNAEHWMKAINVSDEYLALLSSFNVRLTLKDLQEIHSISFANSMVFIEKKRISNNVLGKRIIRGRDAKVAPKILELGI